MINLTPFVDVLICLTAFLLVTAVWQENSYVEVQGENAGKTEQTTDVVSILLDSGGIRVESAAGNRSRFDKQASEYRWDALATLIGSWPPEHRDAAVRVAATDNVRYDAIIRAMSLARDAGYRALSFGDSRVMARSFATNAPPRQPGI